MPASKELFKKYPNPVFIETGSFYGGGIQHAIDAGFKNIYSIELSPTLYNHCMRRFKDYPNVYLILGDSSDILKELLPAINEPVTFWLDGHYSGDGTALGSCSSPVMKELEIIANHKIKNHTILIDDLRIWTIEEYGFNTDILKNRITEINNEYVFSYEDGLLPDGDGFITFKNDILVAKINN